MGACERTHVWWLLGCVGAEGGRGRRLGSRWVLSCHAAAAAAAAATADLSQDGPLVLVVRVEVWCSSRDKQTILLTLGGDVQDL